MTALRILYDNAADRSSISAATTSGTLVATNLLTEGKSVVHRSTTTTMTLTLTWTLGESMSAVVFPWTNLTAGGTIRVRGYTNSGDPIGSPLFDTGTATACKLVPSAPRGLPAGVNSFAYGSGACAAAYFAAATVRKLIIDLVDSGNAAGYIEAARMLCGAYWAPAQQPTVGAKIVMMDRTTQERSDAGDLRRHRGTRAKKLSFALDFLKAADRNSLWDMLRGNGLTTPIFVSLLSGSSDATEEGIHEIYGAMSQASELSYQFYGASATSLEIEEM
jgi:hypothetical protein